MLKTFSLNPLFWSFPNLGACLGPASMSLEAFDEERVQQMEAETEAQEVRARWLDGMLIVRCSYSLSYNLYIYMILHYIVIVYIWSLVHGWSCLHVSNIDIDYQFPHTGLPTAFGKAEELQSSDDSSRASDYKAACKSRKMTRLVEIRYYYHYYIYILYYLYVIYVYIIYIYHILPWLPWYVMNYICWCSIHVMEPYIM